MGSNSKDIGVGQLMTKFIAEICSNHNGDLPRALALIDKAAEIGCHAVKFQLFRIDQLFAPEALRHPDYQFIQERRRWELPLSWLPVLKARCIERGIEFGCTPFYLNAVEELLPFVDFYKVASYSLLHTELLQAVARTRKPAVLSTGMATIGEIKQALSTMADELEPWEEDMYLDYLTLLHCVSTYPMPARESNPRFYDLLSRQFPCLLGWSDHSANPAVIYHYAIRIGTSMIEFHLDLDGQGNEYGIGHCWLPEQMEPVIKMVGEVWETGKWRDEPRDFSESEQQERLWRADPLDGLRPLKEVREGLRE